MADDNEDIRDDAAPSELDEKLKALVILKQFLATASEVEDEARAVEERFDPELLDDDDLKGARIAYLTESYQCFRAARRCACAIINSIAGEFR